MADIHAKLLEDKILRSLRAKRRFKAIVRHVIHNLYWLIDDEISQTEDIKLTIRKTVSRLSRRKKLAKGITIKEKGILRKLSQYRTEEEKKHLFKCIGNLKCFRRYPEDVQQQLVGVTYFEFYGPNRVLVKEDHPSHALYFLLSGEIAITRLIYDEVTKEWNTILLGKNFAGSMFGEVALLHDIPRTATVTTTVPCELLVLYKDDFNRILKNTLMKRWEEVQEAMYSMVYFKEWDNLTIRECCLLSKIKTYKPNDVILGDGIGPNEEDTVFFILEGECAIIEHLFVEEHVYKGAKYYKQYDIISEQTSTESSTNSNILPYTVEQDQSNKELPIVKSKLKLNTNKESVKFLEKMGSCTTVTSQVEENRSLRCSQSVPDTPSVQRVSEIRKTVFIQTFRQLLQKERKTNAFRFTSIDQLPQNVKIKFMQICSMRGSAIFMKNDTLANRRVVATTEMKCLLIPGYFLFQQNKANMWTRIEQYLDLQIPSRQEVFEEFVKGRKWQDYKRKIRDDVLKQRKFPNNTTIHDVPYSIRVNSNYE